MAKEGARYLEEILATRANLPPRERRLLERAIGVLHEVPKVSFLEAAEILRERSGAAMVDETPLPTMRNEVSVEDRFRDPVLSFRDQLGLFSRHVRLHADDSLRACVDSGIATAGDVRRRSLAQLKAIPGLGTARARFVEIAFKPLEP